MCRRIFLRLSTAYIKKLSWWSTSGFYPRSYTFLGGPFTAFFVFNLIVEVPVTIIQYRLKGARCKNWPLIKFFLKTNRGQCIKGVTTNCCYM